MINARGSSDPAVDPLSLERGLLLKGEAFANVWPELWPIALFTLATVLIAIWFYRETLDETAV